MKYAIIIAGGGGEPVSAPVPELEGFTPLEAAPTPALDALGELGRQGVVQTTPDEVAPGMHAPVFTLLGAGGHDVAAWAPSRGAIEAIGLSAGVPPDGAAWHLSPVTMDDDFATIADPFPLGLTAADTRSLVESLRAALAGHPVLSRFRIVEGAGPLGSEAVLILEDAPEEMRSGRASLPGADAMGGGRALIRAFPRGATGEMIRALCELSADVFQAHPVNTIRAEHDLRPVSMFWAEGGGGAPAAAMERLDLRAAMITGDAAGAGSAHLLGIDRLPVPGELTGPRADFRAMAGHAIEALDRYDLVVVHTDAMAAASLAGDWRTKTALWERLDEEVVGPLHARLIGEGDGEADAEAGGWRLMVACDSVCSTARRARTGDPAPFVMGGAFVRSVLRAPFSDAHAHGSDLKINPGRTLLEYFLYSGLRAARRRSGATVETHQRER